MDKHAQELKATQAWVRQELDRCLEFWLKNGMDHEHGGVYTCLDRTGKVFSTDKSVWMQGRCGWIFAYLCRVYGKKQEWLDASKSCIDFLEEHCVNRAAGGRLYFTVTADGRPLRQRRYCFSEGFYAMANAEYYGVTGDAACLERARAAYELIYQLNNGLIQDPTGLGPKTIPETRTGRALADPMIYLNITAVMRRCDPERTALYDARARECCETIFKYHHKPEMKCTLETVGMNGELQMDFTAGRVVNPGHDIECSWFLMEQANYEQNAALHKKAQNVFDYAYEAGWDSEYGGLLYFIDCKGLPPEAYEHDMKLWWPHDELLIASMMLYRDLGEDKYLAIFDKALDYCKKVFSDPEYGEWYGYLRRDGKPTEPPCKGSTFKGPFHLPRMLVMVDQTISQILAR
ncbi:AGE family epimerase/isomerase [Allofournierella sp.]|uniref:AGE family epimerase/isomerase n=1 Tax=Allofournierella sp. TaxID=1940256 RepID=UPI003AEF3926